jgi:hypothetical protein
MTRKAKYLLVLTVTMLISIFISFIVIKPRIDKTNRLKIELGIAEAELESVKEKLVELDLENWDRQIKRKLDSYLEFGKTVIEINKDNTLDVRSIEFAHNLLERSLYSKNLEWIFFARDDEFYSAAKVNPNKTILVSSEFNKTIQNYEYSDEKQVFEYAYDMSDYIPTERTLYKNITNDNRENWINPYKNIKGYDIMTFTKGFFDKEGKKIGVWGVELNSEDIQQYLNSIKPTSNTKVELIFNPKQNIILSESDEENYIIRQREYNYDNYNWTIQWMIPKDEYKNYGL